MSALINNQNDQQKKKEDLVKYLVSMSKEVKADDTMQEFNQVLRFDFIVKPNKPLTCQILLDRRHKVDNKKSRPLGYLHFSYHSELLSIVENALIMAVVLALSNREKGVDVYDIKKVIESVMEIIIPDAERRVLSMVEIIEKKRKELNHANST